MEPKNAVKVTSKVMTHGSNETAHTAVVMIWCNTRQEPSRGAPDSQRLTLENDAVPNMEVTSNEVTLGWRFSVSFIRAECEIFSSSSYGTAL